MFKAELASVGLVVLALVTGCSGDDDGGGASDDGSGGGGSTGGSGGRSESGGESIVEAANLDADQPASELTADEAGDLCDAGNALLTRNLSCTTDAVARTDDAAECEALRDSCASKPAQDECDPTQTQADIAECSTVTVGDISACLEEIVAWMKTLSCAAPADEGTRPACMEELHSSCPMLFGGGEASGEQGGGAGSGGQAGEGGGDALSCEGVEADCVEAYQSFCDCCPRSGGCAASEDPCTTASNLQADCEADADCAPGCGNWVIGDCADFRTQMADSCMY